MASMWDMMEDPQETLSRLEKAKDDPEILTSKPSKTKTPPRKPAKAKAAAPKPAKPKRARKVVDPDLDAELAAGEEGDGADETVVVAPEHDEAFFAKHIPIHPLAKLEPNEETLRTIAKLAGLACTGEEIAAYLGVDRRTFFRFMERHPEARFAWENGHEIVKISLRRKQLRLAEKNPAMSIFLGKNILGQKDERTSHVNLTKTVREMSDAELMSIASSGKKGKAKEEPDLAETVH